MLPSEVCVDRKAALTILGCKKTINKKTETIARKHPSQSSLFSKVAS